MISETSSKQHITGNAEGGYQETPRRSDPGPGIVQVYFRIPPDLHEAVRQFAISTGVTHRELWIRAMREYLAARQSARAVVEAIR